MTTCAFLLHNYKFDDNFYYRLRLTISKIVKKDNVVRFLFCNMGVAYYKALFAVLEIKQRNPNKNIEIVFVSDGLSEKENEFYATIPRSAYDKVIFIPIDKNAIPKTNVAVTRHENCLRWIFNQSDIVISYAYQGLYSLKCECYDPILPIKEFGNIKIMDISKICTAQNIEKTRKTLSESEQAILANLDSGLTPSKIASNLNLSKSAVCKIIAAISETLELSITLNEQVPDKKSNYISCCIFRLMKPNEEKLKAFRQILIFLMNAGGVNSFSIEHCYDFTEYYKVLIEFQQFYPKIQVKLITCYNHIEQIEDNHLHFEKLYHFKDIENIIPESNSPSARTLRTIKALMQRSKFGISNFSGESLYFESILRHIPRSRGIVMFDINNF